MKLNKPKKKALNKTKKKCIPKNQTDRQTNKMVFILCWTTTSGQVACPEVWFIYPEEIDFLFPSTYKLQMAF